MRHTPEPFLAGGLAIAVTAFRFWLIRPLSFCGTPDACFYLGMAQNLATGHGFHARFLYDFQQAHLTLPNTGLEYWRPGISLILLLLQPFGGVTLHGSILLTMLIGILFSAAAWHIAMSAYGNRRLALGSFALCLFSPSVWSGSLSPDSGIFYGASIAWFLALFTVRRQGLVQDLLALGCVCIAYFVRNDAALLLLPLLAVLWQRHRNASSADDRDFGTSVPYAICMIVGFSIALVPMHLLYRQVLGTALPTGTSKALYLNELSDMVRYGDPASLHSLLAHGITHLVTFRIATFATVVYRIAVLMIGYAALVFLPGLLFRDPSTPKAERLAPHGQTSPVLSNLPEWTGAAVFFLAALLAYTLVLPAVGGFAALRTTEAVMPLADVLVLVAVLRTVRTPRLAWMVVLAVIGANALGGLMQSKRDLASMNEIGDRDHVEARQLALMGGDPATSIVMTDDPVQFSVTTGYTTIALPVNGLGAITQAARDFRVTHVILNTESLPAPSDQINGQVHTVRSATLPAEHTSILELPSDHAR
ncbi:MAG: hypothetical protein ACRYFU_18260 [Janthinobacterium lividum]